MKILGCQWDLTWEEREPNFAAVERLLENESGDLIILPEMFGSGFSMNLDVTAEPESLPTETFLRDLARNHDAAVLGGLARRGESGKGRNELVGFTPEGKKLGSYQKNRTFRYTGEPDYFENGNELALFEWQGWKLAPLICYDLRFPELFRRLTARGAELFVVVASWPTARVEHWITLLRARAIENLAYVIGVNRCGRDPNADYPGRSLLIDPRGEILSDAGSDEGVVSGEIDLGKVRQWRSEFPALEDLEI